MSRASVGLSLVLTLVVGCGAQVVFVGDGEEGGGGSQHGSTIAAGASTGDGAGFVGFGGESGTGGVTGTGGACADGTIELTNPPQLSLDSVCGWGSAWTSRPTAYFLTGGPGAAGLLVIEGCLGDSNIQLRMTVVVDGPGTYTSGNAFFQDPNGQTWESTSVGFLLTLDALEKVGGSVDGTAKLELANADGTILDLPAVFHVCRVEDENLP